MADVITVTAGSAGQAGSTAAELITYMSARLLEVAELNTILDQFGDKHPLPANSSKTIRFTREEKLSVASTPTQLSEGVPPDASAITINQFLNRAVFDFMLEHPKASYPFIGTIKEILNGQSAGACISCRYN